MTITDQDVTPIAKGYPYAVRVRVVADQPPFPMGCAIRADVRAFAGSNVIAEALSTLDQTIVRIDDDTIELRISNNGTANIGNISATLDLVRFDMQPEQWIGVQITLPVINPVTVAV